MEQEKRLEKIPDNMKTIGIIGGLGQQATMDFVARVHKISQDLIPQFVNRGYPPLHVFYFRHAPMALNPDGSTPNVLEPDPRLLELAKIAGKNADFIVIPSNTPHLFQKQIEEASGRKMLSIVDVTLEEVKRRSLKKVGVLAIGDTLKHRLYQNRLDEIGVTWEIIPDKIVQKLDESIWAVMEGKTRSNLGEPAREAVDYLRAKNTDGIILGCTELPLLLKDEINVSDLINPSQLLAEAAVKFATAK